MDSFSYLSNAHTAVIDDLYQAWKSNPETVDTGWQKFFEGFEFSLQYGSAAPLAKPNGNGTDKTAPVAPATAEQVDKELRVRNLILAWRSRGHLLSKTNPVRPRRNHQPRLDITDFGLSDADLETPFAVGHELGIGVATLRQIVEALKKIYEGPIGFEYMYIRDPEVLDWFKRKVESESLAFNPPIEYKTRILSKLNEAVVFENFLHTKYVGQKRFSLEGGESTIAALDATINTAADLGVEEVIIGMAHRGRLNVLCNILGKTYEQIFSEFEGTAQPDLTMGDGDVKYHMGYSSQINTPSGRAVNLKLAPNPSHLEAVNPVVEGFARAMIDHTYGGSVSRVLPILIHGDAAVAGQGIVLEVTQMANLPGYTTGGTIHFVINNQVGFTTDFDDARSSIYCTDVAKMIDAPVLHVNGDDPEAVVFCMNLAAEYRQRFGKDIFVDMVCYRRHGHNESDEPKFTQPSLYSIIAKHPNPREVYNARLIARGDVDAKLAEKMDQEFRKLLQDRLNLVKEKPLPYAMQKLEADWLALRKSTPTDFESNPPTAVTEEVVGLVGKALSSVPENFKPLKQVEKLLKDRQDMFFESRKLNWASAELLAFGATLLEGKPVRMSGQDVKRGTFSHRHAVLFDSQTNAPYCNLDHLAEGQTQTLAIYNSLLSEYGVLGFEFGYAMANPNALVLWEAQFGDFANGAQVMIDQFISCSESKWQRMNGIICLLPHGYEGQGPEHSNARPERFLQLAAEYNIGVYDISSPANYFHMLRRQLAWPFRKPAIVMSPKSLLRHPAAVSDVSEFVNGGFQEVIADETVKAKDVKQVILCTGKLYYELLEKRNASNRTDVAIVRLEQLAPFPKPQLEKVLAKYKGAQVRWVQEEPENMGALTYVLHQVRDTKINLAGFVARKPSASPATGYAKVHNKEQESILERAFAS